MNANIKKIIAREGLVILSIPLLMFMTSLIPEQITIKDKKNTPKESESTFEITTQGILSIDRIYTILVDKNKEKASLSTAEELPKGFVLEKDNNSEYDKNGIKWYKLKNSIEKTDNVIKEVDSFVELKSHLFLFFLFSAYPLYLLIRFIIWAIRTLKEK